MQIIAKSREVVREVVCTHCRYRGGKSKKEKDRKKERKGGREEGREGGKKTSVMKQKRILPKLEQCFYNVN